MLDAPPPARKVLSKWVLRALVCAGFSGAAFLMFNAVTPGYGPIGLLFTAPLWGVAFARPLIDALAGMGETVAQRARAESQGMRLSFKGTSLHIDEWLDVDDDIDGKEHLCVALADLLNALGVRDRTATTARLAAITHPLRQGLRDRPYVRLQPLIATLRTNDQAWDGSVTLHDHWLRLAHFLESDVLHPWERKRGRRAMTPSFEAKERAAPPATATTAQK